VHHRTNTPLDRERGDQLAPHPTTIATDRIIGSWPTRRVVRVVGGLDAEHRVEGLVPVDPAILVIARAADRLVASVVMC